MLDRNSHTPGPEPLSERASQPAHTEALQGGDPCRVAGEDAPAWLAASFAVIGTMIACASVAAWQQGAIGSTEVAPPPLAAPVERLSQTQDDASAGPSALVRGAVIPAPPQQQPQSQPQPAPDDPPAAAPGPAAPSVASDAAPLTVGAGTSPLPDRRMAPAQCFGPLTISFAHNSARPEPADVRRSIEPLRRWRSTHGDAIIVIEGHSDTTGAEDVNVLLSYSRAKAVAGLLQREGMPARQMTVRAAGSSEAAGGASDRSALLRMAGVEDCGGVVTATKGP